MGSVARNIFKAIHQQKWLSVEYHNKEQKVTYYWIGINAVYPDERRLKVDGLNLGTYECRELTLYLDSIASSAVIEGSYHATPPELLRRLETDVRFEQVFGTVANLKILDYLYDCARLDNPPCVRRFSLLSRIDEQSFFLGQLKLDGEQFGQLVRLLQKQAGREGQSWKDRRIALNVLSLHTKAGLYVLAYRELRLNVLKRTLTIGRNTVLCREFVVGNGKAEERQSIRLYLDETDLPLLERFDENREAIKDRVSRQSVHSALVDDTPHVFVMERFAPTYLQGEYEAIASMCQQDQPTYPIRAFFGNLLSSPRRLKDYPVSLVTERANLDQLLVINQAVKYPLTYVQGPPGTGKTSTIQNVVVNAFCNGKTVLFASYNNHPVDGVFEALASLEFDGMRIAFPILRLGSRRHMVEALDYMRDLYARVKDLHVSRNAPRFSDEEKAQRARALTALLKEYEREVDLHERRECVTTLADSSTNLNFSMQLQGGQLAQIDQQLSSMRSLPELSEQARGLVDGDREGLMQFLYVASLYRIKRLGEPKYADLLDIVNSDEADESRVKRFNAYLAEPRTFKALQRIFPIMATTCISARRLGPPEPTFDITVIDEASQCDTATALIPIVRGKGLLLVGDPQQLNPVVTIDKDDSIALRRAYRVGEEYDYVKNSLYKCFLACDSVSSEILLHEHYRCDERIIAFNNRKYYGNQLTIRSGRHLPVALEYVDVGHNATAIKNAAPAEADAVVRYALENPQLSIGIITPFANQREAIAARLSERGVSNASCGTVHAFQGDEKDVILFSTALTSKTAPGTYRWLTDNRELINVATSRAKDRLVLFASSEELERLHASHAGVDDLYELAQYVRTNGSSRVSARASSSRALGVKPYTTQMEQAFLETLNHALGTIFATGRKHVVQHEVQLSAVLKGNATRDGLFFNGRFDFVVYEVAADGTQAPVLAIELDGKEHLEEEAVRERDCRKEALCRANGFQLIRVENAYARRYQHIKGILVEYFERG